ncbi:TonB-dependent receptor [Geovibrio thiophilus]|uniref:TonB-dependent receptor n=1 Tax=Geovibrio thiophilus TaxID=139438 RepID=A0A410JZ28_9BACT|nr:TonB-dependent receptor [Geovibrio thiophilus]QAR33427.1 TonB-dependent receptor [Geovibrio thiophilus]
MYRKLIFVLPLLVFSLISASAAEMETEKIKVTATRVEKEMQEVPYTVNVITEEDIRKSGATSLAELLRDIPSVQMTSTGAAGIQRLSLRGESSSRTLIMVDGMKITEQKSMDGTPLLIDVNSIERIEIIKGPGSVLYGSEAIGGAINIITKKGGDRPVQGMLSYTYNTNSDSFNAAASLYGGVKNFYYRAEVSQNDFGKREDSHGDELDGTEYENTNMSLLAGYKNKKFDTGAQYTKYESESDVYVGEIEPPFTDMFMELPEWNREKYAGWFEYRNPGSFLNKARLDVFTQETYKKFINNMDMVVSMGPISMPMSYRGLTKNTLDTTGVLGQFDFELTDTNLLIAGFEYNIDELNAKDNIQTFGAPAATLTDTDAKQTTMSAFINDEQVLGSFILSAGLRYTKVENEIESTNNASIPDEDTDDDNIVGSVSVVYTGIRNTALRALYSSGYRTPNLQQLYMGTTHGSSTPTFSNPDLDPETSDNFEVGARFANKIMDIDLAVFHTKSEDYITTVIIPYGASTANMFANIEKARTIGTELTAKAYVGNFTPYVNGAYMRRKYEMEGLSTYKVGAPELTSRFGLRHDSKFGKKFTLNTDLYGRYASKTESAVSDGSIDVTESYTTLNLALTGSYAYKDGRRIMLGVEALNINNQDYELAMSPIPEPGRHFILKVSADF